MGGGGRTVLNLQDHIDAGTLDATIDLVIASRETIAGVARCRERGLPTVIAPASRDGDLSERHETIAGWLHDHDIELVCLCGYLQWFRVDPPYRNRVMNIHPALLPDFGGHGMYGDRVHRAVLASGSTRSGCTVHFVDDQYDHGPIILQRECPVEPDDDVDTLAARVFELEKQAYPQAVQWFAEGRLRSVDGQVEISAK
jgi:folate-dependent phosphoribosylglycinamide formyltransferase PurN